MIRYYETFSRSGPKAAQEAGGGGSAHSLCTSPQFVQRPWGRFLHSFYRFRGFSFFSFGFWFFCALLPFFRFSVNLPYNFFYNLFSKPLSLLLTCASVGVCVAGDWRLVDYADGGKEGGWRRVGENGRTCLKSGCFTRVFLFIHHRLSLIAGSLCARNCYFPFFSFGNICFVASSMCFLFIPIFHGVHCISASFHKYITALEPR